MQMPRTPVIHDSSILRSVFYVILLSVAVILFWNKEVIKLGVLRDVRGRPIRVLSLLETKEMKENLNNMKLIFAYNKLLLTR